MALTAYRFPVTSSPSDFGEIDDAQYGMMAYIRGRYQGCTQGFSDTGNGFAVTPGTGMQVRVDTGDALILDGPINNSAAALRSISAAHASLDRYDLVVLRQDASLLKATAATIVVKTGTASGTPVIPSLTQSPSGIWEMPLALVFVGAGVTSISAGSVIDIRPKPRIPVIYHAASSDFRTAAISGTSSTEVSVVNISPTIPVYPGFDYRVEIHYMEKFADTVNGSGVPTGHANVTAYVNGTQVETTRNNAGNNMPVILFADPLAVRTYDQTLFVDIKAKPITMPTGVDLTPDTTFRSLSVRLIPA